METPSRAADEEVCVFSEAQTRSQVYLRDLVGPDHHSKLNHRLFAGGRSCLPFVKTQQP